MDVSIDAFVDALLGDSPAAAGRIVAQQRRDGASLESVYLKMLAQSVQRLGAMWEDDSLSFIGLTVAAGRVFEIMRNLRYEIAPVIRDDAGRRSILLASVPGDQHTVGVTIAADLLRAAGWGVCLETGLDHDALMARIAGGNERVVGLSASNIDHAVPLTRAILALRIERPDALLVVGGGIIDQEPDLNALLHADFLARPGENPVASLEALITDTQARPIL